MGDAKKRRHLATYMIIILLAVLLLIRCFYSFCWSDEGFYLSIVHRLWVGDKPFVDEWSGVQLYAVVLLPFYALYRLLASSSDGVYLFFRILMVLANSFLSIYIYRLLRRKYSNTAALLGSLGYLLYTRSNIQGASYYSISIFFFTWSLCLVYSAETERKEGLRFFGAGCTLALAVLAIPYLAFVYLLAAGMVMLVKRFAGCRKKVWHMLSGTLFCAVCYLLFLFSRIGFCEFANNFGRIFQDSEHHALYPLFSVPLWPVRIAYRYKETILISLVLTLYLYWSRRGKKEKSRRKIEKGKGLIGILALSIYLVDVWKSGNMLGCAYVALALLTVTLYLLAGEDHNQHVEEGFRHWFIPGIVFSVIFHMASNTGLDAMTTGFAVCAVIMPAILEETGKVIFKSIFDWVEPEKCRKYGKIIMIAAVGIALFQIGFLRIFSVYRDAGLDQLTARITQGPAKYLYTTEEHKEQYSEICDAVSVYCGSGNEGTIVISELVPWAYLCVDRPYGSLSPCRFWGGFSEERGREYYEANPLKMPEFLLSVKPEYGSFQSVYIQGNENAQAPNGTGVADWLIEEVESRGYAKKELFCGTLYQRAE